MVDRIPEVTGRILANIPRMEGVREIVAGHRRRFDSGELAEGARMLRIAVDFVALEAEGAEAFLALETMRGRIGVYDPQLLEPSRGRVGVRTHSLEVAEIRLAGLEVGMRLVHDVRARDRPPADLARAPGHAELLDRLHNFPPGTVVEPLARGAPVTIREAM